MRHNYLYHTYNLFNYTNLNHYCIPDVICKYIATVFGDPHVITFDDLEYTFNGKGEFVLVHVDSEKFKFDVQGRFEQLPDNIYGPVRATTLTSVVSRDNTSTVIEVRLRPRVAQWRYRLDVFADGKRVYFDRPALKVQHFHGKLRARTLLLFLLLYRSVIG